MDNIDILEIHNQILKKFEKRMRLLGKQAKKKQK